MSFSCWFCSATKKWKCNASIHSGWCPWLHFLLYSERQLLLAIVLLGCKVIGYCSSCRCNRVDILLTVVIRHCAALSFYCKNVQHSVSSSPCYMILYHTMLFMSALKSLLFNLSLQPFWQVVSFSDSRGRGVVGKCCYIPLCIITIII